MELNEKQEKGVEFIENGLYNIGNFKKIGSIGVLNMAKTQIENGLKLLKGEKISDGGWGAPKEDDNKEKDKKQN